MSVRMSVSIRASMSQHLSDLAAHIIKTCNTWGCLLLCGDCIGSMQADRLHPFTALFLCMAGATGSWGYKNVTAFRHVPMSYHGI